METAAILETLQEALSLKGELWVAPHGVSMGRRYAKAESLLVQPAIGPAPQWGSFVVVRAGDAKWVAHRVIARSHRDGTCRFLTKGDGRAEADWPWRTREDWIGTVVAVQFDGQVLRLDTPREQWRARLRAATGLLLAVACEARRALLGKRR